MWFKISQFGYVINSKYDSIWSILICFVLPRLGSSIKDVLHEIAFFKCAWAKFSVGCFLPHWSVDLNLRDNLTWPWGACPVLGACLSVLVIHHWWSSFQASSSMASGLERILSLEFWIVQLKYSYHTWHCCEAPRKWNWQVHGNKINRFRTFSEIYKLHLVAFDGMHL